MIKNTYICGIVLKILKKMKAIKMLLLAGVAMMCACQPSQKSESSKSLLLLVDVQYDFITGSLAVDGAPAVMDSLAQYIANQPEG